MQILLRVAAIGAFFGGGVCTGFLFYPQLFSESPADAFDPHGHGQSAAASEPPEDLVVLTPQAMQNLELSMGRVETSDYWRCTAVPGEVIEIPGQSSLSISAPVTGVVQQVHVREGQSVAPGDPLFLLRIIDQDLTTAQTTLLEVLSRLDVVNQEIQRLAPLTESGTVTGRRKLELEYEASSLVAQRETKLQELLARGLPWEALRSIVDDKRLANQLPISVPVYLPFSDSPPTSRRTATRAVAASAPLAETRDMPLSVAALRVHPGMTVQHGDDLCDLAYHSQLYIRGQAFESDLAAITGLAETGWRVSAEFGHQHSVTEQSTVRSGLRLLNVDNHVDLETQTFAFYLPLENEVVQDLRDEHGVLFRQWRFKPGQRVHLRVPVERWESQIKLPIEAVAIEGANAIVFRRHQHPHAHDEADAAIELEPVPVHVLHRDDQSAVVAQGGPLQVADEIAMNNAYKLQLALEMQAGGGGHHHDHE